MVDGRAGIMEQVHLPSADLSLSTEVIYDTHTKLPIITRNQKKSGLQRKQRSKLPSLSPLS